MQSRQGGRTRWQSSSTRLPPRCRLSLSGATGSRSPSSRIQNYNRSLRPTLLARGSTPSRSRCTTFSPPCSTTSRYRPCLASTRSRSSSARWSTRLKGCARQRGKTRELASTAVTVRSERGWPMLVKADRSTQTHLPSPRRTQWHHYRVLANRRLAKGLPSPVYSLCQEPRLARPRSRQLPPPLAAVAAAAVPQTRYLTTPTQVGSNWRVTVGWWALLVTRMTRRVMLLILLHT
mmetsp:Transcript_14692/g.43482  ORF Transcript_14692/g.43482 Transcript_14692/m.43482 type:complete len:234 (+) Transcript_14692:391-1092(+)